MTPKKKKKTKTTGTATKKKATTKKKALKRRPAKPPKRKGGAPLGVVSVKTLFAAAGVGSANCEIIFTIAVADGAPAIDRTAHIDSPSNALAFSGDTATARVAPGPHLLVWAARGAPGQSFKLKLSGDVAKEHNGSGKFPPPDGLTGSGIHFVAVEP